jgi:hypothetical protein
VSIMKTPNATTEPGHASIVSRVTSTVRKHPNTTHAGEVAVPPVAGSGYRRYLVARADRQIGWRLLSYGRSRDAPCDAVTGLTAAELAPLCALTAPVAPAQRSLTCELAAGHEGEHLAFAIASHDGDLWWWLRWSDQRREIMQVDPCDAEPLDASNNFCALPRGHHGPHSFAL